MIRIMHPRPQLGRQHALGVEFVDGIAEATGLHPDRELALTQHGFTIESGDVVDLTTLTKRELLDIADVEGVEVPKGATKATLVNLISRLPAGPFPGEV
ncbi:hypothetical protein J2Y69_002130 [Microbacterium resistens]|uniref:Rho termination factor N-terminal domain-containing protein n=1 Tax=Microbacterium resistens TaxID=156977 RepID=A0ABU1SD41_9MICO|nr:hypothetical protein [Microbacterium resistens]MDR6867526.1 hypothetical protein [Microbacterium resistens]